MEDKKRKVGRPKLERPSRVPVTTTIDRKKLEFLREHAMKNGLSLGQIADRFVQEQFGSGIGRGREESEQPESS